MHRWGPAGSGTGLDSRTSNYIYKPKLLAQQSLVSKTVKSMSVQPCSACSAAYGLYD